MLLSEADAALGRLAGSGRLLPDPHLLVNAYITREAVSSSRIEGTQASVTEVFDAAATGETKRDDIREVRNYVAALQHGVRRLKEDEFPISLRLIKEMHKILLTGVRGQDKTPGEFRTSHRPAREAQPKCKPARRFQHPAQARGGGHRAGGRNGTRRTASVGMPRCAQGPGS